jgi:biopolymer transport protein ExbD
MDVGGSSGGVKADINVTPLVDVMLVLLIIMMLVAPMIQQGAPVRLPVATNRADKPETQEQTVIAISANGDVYLNADPVTQGDLGTRIANALANKKDKLVLIKADRDAAYGKVMSAMDDLRTAGIEDIGLITDPVAQDPRRASAGGR